MRTVVAVLALVACVHAGLWVLLRTEQNPPNFPGKLESVSVTYAASVDSAYPGTAQRPTPEQIRADLKAIAPYTKAIRLYSSTGGAELVPPIAAEFGLKVTAGAWIEEDKDTAGDWIEKNRERNEREIRSALELARHNSNVNAIVVGNETSIHTNMSVEELIALIQNVKRQSPVPVTTGETWMVWIDHPELASAVDFIGAHILPYWDGFDASRAADQTIESYDKLRRMHPGKRIVIAEFGWPSAGYNMLDANPGRMEQAAVIRDFVHRAEAYGIDYNIVEAIDQPWKTAEGGVGPYWGLFDASRDAKFSWTGAITDPDYIKRAGLAVLLGVLLSLPILAMSGATAAQALMLAASANAVGAWFAAIVAFWKGHYFVPGAAFALGLGLLLLIPLVAIALARLEEIATIAFGRGPRRLANAPPLVPAQEAYAPKVSIHVPACREAPEMLVQTLDAVSRIDYPNFECVVVINNTPDPAYWEPIEAHCRTLGERFKFLRVDKLTGYKAGALRVALDHTAADAEIIGSIDADYVVEPNWLKDLVPLFADARVGFVQAPQDHRDGDRSVMHCAMNAEYAGFFDIGMVQRNEVNAIVMHGTMALIRRAALEAAGNWSTDTIVEDTDLGIAILEHGYVAHYTNHRYGHGLLPDTFDAYKRQRQRWAYGGFQLLRKHWRKLLPGAEGLSREQKREYGIGWLNWLGSDSIGVVVALLNIVWVPFVVVGNLGIPKWIHDLAVIGVVAEWFAKIGAVPDRILTLPIIAVFTVAVAHFITLYRLRVRVSPGQMLGAVCAAMAVQWTVARAVIALGVGKPILGAVCATRAMQRIARALDLVIVNERVPFLRTAKGGGTRKGPDFPAFWEAVIAVLLSAAALTLVITNFKQVHEINIFALVLVVQSLPFIAAVILATIEGTRLNAFAYWRGVEAKAAALLPQLSQQQVIAEPPKLPAENRIEAAQ
jgi:exo-beta-1,3-glucanase (GH17 family)/glycosyltransferase involved in cell wall biosynthesis